MASTFFWSASNFADRSGSDEDSSEAAFTSPENSMSVKPINAAQRPIRNDQRLDVV
jgi:hypothetical protein